MIKSQALGGKSSKALLFLGLFLGLVSAVLVVVYLRSATGDGDGNASGVAVTPVVVANHNIPVGTRVTEEMVVQKKIASDAVLADAYQNIKDVIGQVTLIPLVAGEQVIPDKVAATGAAIEDVENAPLSRVVPDKMRAVAVQVDSVIAASGLIRAGDYVDVILTVKIEGGDSEEGSRAVRDQIARTVLQNAQVLSIDQDVALPAVEEGAEGASAGGGDSDANPDATTVTLAVSPAHGEVLTVAETCGNNFSGRLALALRGLGDDSAVKTRSVWADDGAPPTCAGLLGLDTLN